MNKGERIRKLREAKGISQTELANMMNTAKQTISKYEMDVVTNIPSDRLEELCRILDTTPNYILGWEKGEDPFTKEERELILAIRAKGKSHLIPLVTAIVKEGI